MDRALEILIVAAVPANAGQLERHLQQHSRYARCQSATNRQELDDALDRGLWDVVLMDDGQEDADLQAALSTLQRHHAGLPLILVSDPIGEERTVELLRGGVWDLVLRGNLGRLGPVIERNLHEATSRRNRDAEAIALDRSRLAALNMMEEAIEARGRAEKVAADLRREMAERQQAEAALRREQEFTAGLLNTAQAIVLVLDTQGRIVQFNTYLEEISGRQLSELRGQDWFEIFLPQRVRAMARRLFAEAIRGCPTRGNVDPLLTADGSERLVEWQDKTLKDASGTVIGLLAIGQDVTARVRAEEALRESEERYRALFEGARDGMAVADVESGRLVDCNETLCRLVERDRAELIGQPQAILHAPQTLIDGCSPSFRQHLLDPQSAPLEDTLLAKSGTTIPVEIQGTCLRVQGRDYLMGIFRDVSERRQAEETQARLSIAIEQAAEIVVITDTAAVIQYVNPAFTRITGYGRDEAIGKNPRILKSGKQDAAFYRRVWDTLAAGKVWQGRLSNRRKDGTLYTEEATISPVRDASGTTVNYVAVKRDISRELSLEAQFLQAQRMEAVGRLAGGVAHDFNNLLMGIMNYTELCLDEVGSEHAVRPWLNEIGREAQRSANLTRQLLAFARKQTIVPEILDLNETVGGMLKLLRRLIGEDIDLTWLPGADLWPVKLDPGQVDQILANLCVNARDAIAGVGHITIETGKARLDATYCAEHAEAQPGEHLVLTVSDDGCGMDPEVLPHIFEPFFTTKAVGKGTGLGLATVYGIVQQNHGAISVSSEPGKGTTFRIYLPRASAAAESAAEIPSATERPRGVETILLVEDEKSLRVTCRLFLVDLGYTVLMAEAPAAALDLARQHPDAIHLLLTDVIMPGMDGRQLARQLQETRPNLRCLFMSGYTANAIAHHGVLEEGLAFLAKPFTRDALARKVRDVLGSPAAAPGTAPVP